MSNKTTVIYLLCGVILGLIGVLAYLVLFYNGVGTETQYESKEPQPDATKVQPDMMESQLNELEAQLKKLETQLAEEEKEWRRREGWLTEDPPGFPTIDMSKVYRPPDLTPVTPLPGEYQFYKPTPRPAAATATAIAGEIEKISRLDMKVDGVYIGSFPSEPGDRFLHFKDGTYVPLPSDVTIALVDKAKIICDGDYCPFFPVFVLKRITTGVTVTVDSAGKLFRDFPSHRRYGKYDASQFTFLETDRREP